MSTFGILCFATGSIVATSIWRGYVLTILWAWFIVPVFSAPPLRVPFAIGLSLITAFLTHQGAKAQDQADDVTERMVKAAMVAFLVPCFALGFGWVVHQFA